MPHFCPSKDFLILTLHTLRASLDWSLTSFLTSQPKYKIYSGPLKKFHDVSISNRKSQKILKRCLLVAKRVLYKSLIDIAPLSSTLHAINRHFWKNDESSRSMICSFSNFFYKITKPHLSDVKFAADSKYALEILISCLVSEIWAFVACFTFSSFLTLILVRFWCMTMQIEAYDLLYKNMK